MQAARLVSISASLVLLSGLMVPVFAQNLVGVSADTAVAVNAGAAGANAGVNANANANVATQASDVAGEVGGNTDLTVTVASGVVRGEETADEETTVSTEDRVAVTQKQSVKLFGFIPLIVDATASVATDGSVSVRYPWWTFLAVTSKASLATKIESILPAKLVAVKNGVTSANASATGTAQANANANARATVKLTASEQARLIAAIKQAMQEEFSASAKVKADAKVK